MLGDKLKKRIEGKRKRRERLMLLYMIKDGKGDNYQSIKSRAYSRIS